MAPVPRYPVPCTLGVAPVPRPASDAAVASALLLLGPSGPLELALEADGDEQLEDGMQQRADGDDVEVEGERRGGLVDGDGRAREASVEEDAHQLEAVAVEDEGAAWQPVVRAACLLRGPT